MGAFFTLNNYLFSLNTNIFAIKQRIAVYQMNFSCIILINRYLGIWIFFP